MSSLPKPFLIIETGRPLPALRRLGRFPHWIRVAAGLRAEHVAVCEPAAGDTLPHHDLPAAVLVTGSGAMVTERHDWSVTSADWLRTAVDRGIPVLGVCYGHQLLADALGGTVGANPNGREMGTVEVEALPTAADDPLFTALPARFAAQATHLQTVQQPPPGAVVLARSKLDGCQAFRFGCHAWGVQFHPEFSTGMMRGYIRARAEPLQAEGVDPEQLARAVRPAPLARSVLSRFAHLVRQQYRQA
jgi:GMP synthase (glutamine-hydrolysing)